MLASEFGICILKYKKYLVAFIALSILFCNIFLGFCQSYTSEVYIKYLGDDAKNGIAVNGERLNPYEIKNSFVVEKALESMGAEGLSASSVQNAVSVTPIIPTAEEEKYASWIENFSDYEASEEKKEYATYYSVKFTTNKGSEFANSFAGALLEQYRLFYAQNYSERNDVIGLPGEAVMGYDYFETSDMLKSKINSNINYIQMIANVSPDFRSSVTGYSMQDLENEYRNLLHNYLASVNRDILQRGLTKNNILLNSALASKTDNAILENAKYAQIAESKVELMRMYSEKNKEYTWGAAYDSWGDESNQVREDTERDQHYNRDEMTYDNLMLEFVDYATIRDNASIDQMYYQNYSAYFNNGDVTDAEVEAKLQEICDKYNELHKITEKTIEDYNNYKSSEHIALVSGISAEKTISEVIYYAVTVVLSAGLGVTVIILLELSKKKKI